MIRRPRLTWRSTALLGLSAALTLSGCVAIPTSGPVRTGLPDLQQAEQYVLQYNAEGPVVGATQEDVVRGFVLAAVSPSEDYAVAREFLSPDYADQWDPSYGVLIDEGSRPYEAEDPETGVLSVSAKASLDEQGTMLPASPGATTDLRFEFVRVGDEWRIASAPNGIILDATTFQTIWSPHQLYFVGARNILVPETRWFLTRSSLATEVIGALLGGPGARLRESVHSGFPAGTTLIANSVPLVDGRARIDLTGNVLEAGPVAMTEIQQQVRATLQTVTGVSGFDLYADGTEMQNVPEQTDTAPHTVTEISNPAVMIDSVLGTIISGEFVEIPALADALAPVEPTAITLSESGESAAALGPAGVSYIDERGPILLDGRAGLLAPDVDLLGSVWTFDPQDPQDPQRLRVTDLDGVPREIPAPWLAGRTPVALRVSPDGARIAALVASDDMSLVLVAGVVRDAAGAPSNTTEEADPELWTAGAPLDLDWVGQRSFATLTRVGTSSKVTLSGPGQLSTAQGSVPDGVSITGGGGRAQIRVRDSHGGLHAPQTGGWQRVESDVEVLAKRG